MMKSVVCIALLFAVLASAFRGPDREGGFHRGPGGHGPGHGNKGQWVAELCSNDSLAQSFLNQTQALITTLQSNGSFGQVLAAQAQTIAYLQSASNTALLSSNCTGYFAGLGGAKALDQQAIQTQQQYQKIAIQAFFQIVQSLVGDNSGENGNF